ncbi:hypothetical protein LZC95_40005 [Pendulispora brunnea]|uniref:Fibrinogen C-terminal domain-containing protein n=1 Tax=Pendulispora brunnea TaxID=2905690 RepID=A0ABZ2K729_9BACT
MPSASFARAVLPFAGFSLAFLFQACGLDEGGVTPNGAPPPIQDSGPGSDVQPRPDTGPPPAGTHLVGGEVLGLQGRDLVLQNNGGDDLHIDRDGAFTFPTAVRIGAEYDVRVKPGGLPTSPHQPCTVTSSSGTVGNVDVQTVRVTCAFFRSCKELKASFPSATTATYVIRPADEKAITRCDMDFDGGGWALIEATSNQRGPADLAESNAELPIDVDKNCYMKAATMKSLAAISTQIHIRQNANSNDSITSKAESAVLLENLRAGNVLNYDLHKLSQAQQVALWTGARATQESVGFSGNPNDKRYPDIYWARNNTKGLHLFGVLSTYEWDGDTNRENNQPMEVYLR